MEKVIFKPSLGAVLLTVFGVMARGKAKLTVANIRDNQERIYKLLLGDGNVFDFSTSLPLKELGKRYAVHAGLF